MTGRDDRNSGRPTALFLNERRSIFSDYARKLREEREQAEAEAQARAEAENATHAEVTDPLLVPSAPAEDENAITSFGEAIPFAAEEKPKKPELKYSDSPYAPDWAKHPSQRKPPPPKPEEEPFRPKVEWFEDLLWKEASDDVRVYCIMDGYWAKGLYGRLLASPDVSWAHMFQGDVALQNIQDAPFIIALKRGHKILRWLVEEGWGDGWGIYFTASTKGALDRYGKTTRLPKDMAPSNEEQVKLCNLTEGMEDPLWLMRRHFRRFSDVEFEEDGRVMDFRYYDPAALRIYLPTCNDREFQNFFGPAKIFFAENYSELEKFNRPHEINVFYALINETNKHKYIAKCYNLNEMRLNNIPLYTCLSESEYKNISIYTLIRLGQFQVFEESNLRSFNSRVVDFIIKNCYIDNVDTKEIYKFVESKIKKAKEVGYKSEIDLLNFVICQLKYGNSFEVDRKYENFLRINNSRHLFDEELSIISEL